MLKFDVRDNAWKICPVCKKRRIFNNIVDETITDLQPKTVYREKTGLIVCSECRVVISELEYVG